MLELRWWHFRVGTNFNTRLLKGDKETLFRVWPGTHALSLAFRTLLYFGPLETLAHPSRVNPKHSFLCKDIMDSPACVWWASLGPWSTAWTLPLRSISVPSCCSTTALPKSLVAQPLWSCPHGAYDLLGQQTPNRSTDKTGTENWASTTRQEKT